MATAPSWWADAGSTRWPPSSAPRPSSSPRTPCGTGRGVPQRVPQPMAPQRSGVRVEVVPVHGGSAGDGRRGPAPRRRGRRRDPHRVKAGADPARLVLHGNAKTDEELELAVKHGLGLVVVDNFDDIDRLERIVPQGRRQRCLVRVIPGVEAATHASQATGHAGSKFGLLPDDARDAIARIERSTVLQLDGVHTHVGHSCSTSNSWPPPSNRSRSSARSRPTTSAAASACATPTTSTHRPSTPTPKRW